MTVKLNLGDQVVEAEKMDFKTLDEAWSSYRLEDGTVVKIKVVASEVYKLPGADPLTGAPQFLMKSSNVMAVEPPTWGASGGGKVELDHARTLIRLAFLYYTSNRALAVLRLRHRIGERTTVQPQFAGYRLAT